MSLLDQYIATLFGAQAFTMSKPAMSALGCSSGKEILVKTVIGIGIRCCAMQDKLEQHNQNVEKNHMT